MIPVALTIAGSDSSGGAGIQADLKTFSALGVYGASAITAITAQNTRGVSGVHAVPAVMVAAQVEVVLSDMPVRAIKLGMLFSTEIIEAVAHVLARWPDIPVILDPVMIATSGDRLIREDAVSAMIRRLFPRALLVTPNLAEAAALTGQAPVDDALGMEAQGRAIRALSAAAVLVKGGHGTGAESLDLMVTAAGIRCFSSRRIVTRNTHGTGCTLSAAIAAYLARGMALEVAVGAAKNYLSQALVAACNQRLGAGAGPVHHFHALWPQGSELTP